MKHVCIVLIALLVTGLAGCGSSASQDGDGWDVDEPYEVTAVQEMNTYDMGTAMQRYAIDVDLSDLAACVRLQLTEEGPGYEGERIGVELPEGWSFAASLYDSDCSGANVDDNLVAAATSAEGHIGLHEEDDGRIESFSVDVDVIFEHEHEELPVRFILFGEEIML